MSARILEGRGLAAELRAALKAQVDTFRSLHDARPSLAVIRVGNDPASVSYARQIDRSFAEAGMGYQLSVFPSDVDPSPVHVLIQRLGKDPQVHGILLQRPLPAAMDADQLMAEFPYWKDVEGASAENLGHLMQNRGAFFPTSTPAAGIEILRHYEIDPAGKHAVVVGRSNILGRPLALLLLHENATVTICHSRTVDLGGLTRQADLLFLATGVPHLITGAMVKPGATVIDFGVNIVDDKMVGDADFVSVEQAAGAMTPVPGGTGPVTTVMLMRNTLRAAEQQVRRLSGQKYAN